MVDDRHVTYLGQSSPYFHKSPLGVVRCALAQSKSKDDWRRTTISSTFTKCGDKNCRIIIDSGSCTSVVSTDTIKRLVFHLFPTLNLIK